MAHNHGLLGMCPRRNVTKLAAFCSEHRHISLIYPLPAACDTTVLNSDTKHLLVYLPSIIIMNKW
jgi:hypothetical protein